MLIANKKLFLLKAIVTFFGAGLSKIAPGTCGSLAGTLSFLILLFKKPNVLMKHPIIFCCVLLLILTIIGYVASDLYIKEIKNNDDPQEIVIDEVVGQLISYFLTIFLVSAIGNTTNVDITKNMEFFGIILAIFPFLLFRFYDIKKPSLVGYFDKNFKNAFGVMMDDIVAGIFAGLTNGFVAFCWFMIFR
jgi:phosphatidylglycerophosphatase A